MSAKSILIVDDDIGIRDTIKEVIVCETIHKVFVAQDGETALDLLRTLVPDLFLLDYWLPGMNGDELINRIRESKRHQSTPVILMSAGRFWPKDLKGIRYLTKPFELDKLLEIVEKSLDSPERG